MKYYFVKNERKSPTTTDEPAWLRKIIKVWKHKYKCGGRLCTKVGDMESLILAPETLEHEDLTEITKAEAQTFVNGRFPEHEKDREVDDLTKFHIKTDKDGNFTNVTFDKKTIKILIKPPDISKAEKSYLGYATNHSGSINDETWALADSPHALTGAVTVNDTKTLTIEAGCAVNRDNDYDLIIFGKVIANGTATARITHQPTDRATAHYDSVDFAFDFNGADAGSSFTYNDFYSFSYCFYIRNALAGAPTINHLYTENCKHVIRNANSSSVAVEIENSLFYKGLAPVITSTEQVTFSFCEAYSFQGLQDADPLVADDCYFHDFDKNALADYVLATDCFFKHFESTAFNSASGTSVLTDCVFLDCLQYGIWGTGTPEITDCDIINSLNWGIRQNGDVTGAHLAGNFYADSTNVDTSANGQTTSTETPAQYSIVTSWTGASATRNTPVPTASSVTATVDGDNQTTITWTTDEYATSKVRWGTSAGVYDLETIQDDEWSNYDGSGGYTKSHSVVLKNIKENTKYYYQVGGQNVVGEQVSWSTEGNFTTSATVADVITVNMPITGSIKPKRLMATVRRVEN